MQILPTTLPDVLCIAPPIFSDARGSLYESFNARVFEESPGYAHGFLALSDTVEFLYKTTDYWMPQYERCILWNDPAIGIDWAISETPILSDKDKAGETLAAAEVFD